MMERPDDALWASYQEWLKTTNTPDTFGAYEDFVTGVEAGSRPATEGRGATGDGPGWFRALGSGWATLLFSGAVATMSQFGAAALAGLQPLVGASVWSSGGVVAIAGSLLMWRLVPRWSQFKRWVWLPLGLIALLSFVVVGAMNSYQIEVVDQEARPATQSIQPTGRFNVVEDSSRICEPGDDYLSCVNSHVALYNSVCVGQPLSQSGMTTCAGLNDFIDDIKLRYQSCGYGCTTSGSQGQWGWPYLHLQAETALRYNNDATPRLTHREQCYFDLGLVRIGACVREAAVT